MTVSELIQALEKFPSDAEVIVEANVFCPIKGELYITDNDNGEGRQVVSIPIC